MLYSYISNTHILSLLCPRDWTVVRGELSLYMPVDSPHIACILFGIYVNHPRIHSSYLSVGTDNETQQSLSLWNAARICLFFSHLCPPYLVSPLCHISYYFYTFVENKQDDSNPPRRDFCFVSPTRQPRKTRTMYTIIQVGNSQNISRFSPVFKSLPIIFIDGATDDADSVRLHNIFLGILIASSRWHFAMQRQSNYR